MTPIVYTPLRLEAAVVRRSLRGARVVRCGHGPSRARRAAAAHPGNAVGVAGLCDALDPRLRPGDVVVASEIRGPNGAVRPAAHGPLLAALRRLGVPALSGPVLSVDHVVRGEERTRLHATGAIAVDRESAWLVPREGPLAVLRIVGGSLRHENFEPHPFADGTRALRALSRAARALDSWTRAIGDRDILLCGPRSFCAGVHRAIDVVERALDRFGPPIYVRKQIIHNVHVVRRLTTLGARFVDELDEVPDGAIVVFSAHGVAPAVRSDAADRNLRTIDATCPLVAKVHAEARRFANDGYHIVLIGHRGHEEVEGTMGEVPGGIELVEDTRAVAEINFDESDRIAYLTQTTLATDETADIVAALNERFPNIVGPSSDDICYATQNRQDAVRAVVRECELMLVVGSRNSSNSRRLVEVAERAGCPAHLIDDESELDPSWLIGTRVVGLTAGASAPEALVQRVVDALASFGSITVSEREVTAEAVRFRLPAEVR